MFARKSIYMNVMIVMMILLYVCKFGLIKVFKKGITVDRRSGKQNIHRHLTDAHDRPTLLRVLAQNI